jgi:signal transduction histidine kinase
VYFFTEHFIEETALHREMSDELRALMAREAQGQPVTLVSTALRYFPPGTEPPALAGLPASTFRRMKLEDRTVQLLSAADDAQHIHVLTQDMGLAVHRERALLLSLVAGVSLTTAAAWWAAGRLARRTLTPLTDLVNQIRRVDPVAPAQRPVGRTGDADIDAIPEAVSALVEELDRVLHRERAFADAASHELRTPLAVIRGAVDVLRERGDTPGPILDRLERAARRAQEDLEALLTLSPAREPATPKEVDLRDVLPLAAEPYLRETAAPPRIVWNWGNPSVARVEPAALSIVFTNLLRNALRAAPHGEIRVDADAHRVNIVDDGDGLPAGWPAGDVRRRGLGLLIAQALAERHGWSVSLKPAQPRGTVASLSLDGAAAPA